jgi:hypothetical protein
MERYRVQTFEKWPRALIHLDDVVVSALAMNGFYYTGVRFRIECVFCEGPFEPIQQCKTSPSIIPPIHFELRQMCSFARGFPCGNIPINPGARKFAAYLRMPSHLIEALDFEPAFMRSMESSMPRDFRYYVDPDADTSDDLDSSFEEHYF